MKRRMVIGGIGAAALSVAAPPARAQVYPQRPVSLVVGGAAGSVPDILARAVAERLGGRLGQPVVVENKAGAAGAIAMVSLARSAPDGHTLGLATMSQLVFNSYLFDKLAYDPLRDVQPVAPLVTGAMVLAAHPSFEASSFAEFVRLAKAQRGTLFVAMPQLGSPPHIVLLLLNRAYAMDVRMVPHRSGSEALNAVMAGEIPLIIEAPTSVAPLVAAGKLKAIVVTGREREPLLPHTPTVAETGPAVPGEAWLGLVAPTGTPASVVERVNREIGLVMQGGDMPAVMERMSFRILAGSPDAFGRMIREGHATWGETIRQSGIRLQ
jgi:tripartite-type tricarboxylate transporter receptor subunit TctC